MGSEKSPSFLFENNFTFFLLFRNYGIIFIIDKESDYER